MKLLLSGALLLLLSTPLFAQTAYQPFTISANPSAQELTQLFTETAQGRHDPFLVLRQVASVGDTVIPALQVFISNTSILKTQVLDANGTPINSVNAPPPNRVYGVMALDLIGTPAAYQVLATVALSDSDSEVRGEALKSFAMSYYYRTTLDSLSPEKGVVHLLLRNTEDTTYVMNCGMRIGEIARQGLKNWTGIDYGDLLPDSIRVKEEKRLGMTIQQYREQWWQQNSLNMVWNKNTGHFEVKQ